MGKKKTPPAGPKRAKPTWTTPRQFRLTDEDLAFADGIGAEMDRRQGGKHTRTDAIRWALRHLAKRIKDGTAET
ncbi:MAG TPA: hypothetical protein VMZ71_09685 [Gemmataceae bacterium]|nr:hypothetical protein [Gemmataceae bacterium]